MFLDGLAESQRRRDMVLSSAVSAGVITAVEAWPDLFEGMEPDEGDPGAFPGRDTDTSAFALERATPESVAADMAALVQASQRVSLREEEPPQFPQIEGLPHTEWT